MPMEFNGSSYPKAEAQQSDPLSTISKLNTIQQQDQQIQKNAIGIDREKLQLFNEHSNTVKRAIGGLLAVPQGELTSQHFLDVYQNLVKAGAMTPEQLAKEGSSLPTLAGSKSPQDYEARLRKVAGTQLLQADTTEKMINYFAGQNVEQHDNQNISSGVQGQITPGGSTGLNKSGFEPRSYTPLQPPMGMQIIPPTTPQNPNPAPQSVIGGSPPVTYPAGKTGGLPIAQGSNGGQAAPIQSRPLPTVQSQYAPGVAEAAKVTGQASGEQLAEARKAAANYQESVTPLEKGIESLERLGTKGTGPGTETINNFKSFILSNFPGVTEKELESVKDFDTAKKYFVQFARQNGDTGTNDKLAAAFSGNPGTTMSNAAAQNVAKTALSLFRMKVAMAKDFDKSGLPDSQYGKWANENSNKYDARAFGADKMNPENRAKLIKSMTADEKVKFKESVNAAERYGLIK